MNTIQVENKLRNQTVYKSYFGFNISFIGENGSIIQLNRKDLFQNLTSRLKQNYMSSIGGLLQLAYLYSNLKQFPDNISQMKKLSENTFMNIEPINYKALRAQCLHDQESKIILQKDGKVLGGALIRECQLTQNGIYQLDKKGGVIKNLQKDAKSIGIYLLDHKIQSKNQVLYGSLSPSWITSKTEESHRLIFDGSKQNHKSLYFFSIEQAIKARDFDIFIQVVVNKKFKPQLQNLSSLQYKLKMTVQLLKLIQQTSRKLIQLISQNHNENQHEMVKSKTDKEYKFPPSQFTSLSSQSQKRITLNKDPFFQSQSLEQESIIPQPVLKQQSSERSHWINDSNFGQSQKLFGSQDIKVDQPPLQSQQKLSEIVEVQEPQKINSIEADEKVRTRMRSQTERTLNFNNSVKQVNDPPEDAFQYNKQDDKESHIEFNEYIHQSTLPIIENKDHTQSLKYPISRQKSIQMKSGYKISFDQTCSKQLMTQHTPVRIIVSKEKEVYNSTDMIEQNSTIMEEASNKSMKVSTNSTYNVSKLKCKNGIADKMVEQSTNLQSYNNVGEKSLEKLKLVQSRANIIFANNYLFDLYHQSYQKFKQEEQKSLQDPNILIDNTKQQTVQSLQLNPIPGSSKKQSPLILNESSSFIDIQKPPQEKSRFQGPQFQKIQLPTRVSIESTHGIDQEMKHFYTFDDLQSKSILNKKKVSLLINSLNQSDIKPIQDFIRGWYLTKLTSQLQSAGNFFVEIEYDQTQKQVYVFIETIRIMTQMSGEVSLIVRFLEKKEIIEQFMQYNTDLYLVRQFKNHQIFKPTQPARIQIDILYENQAKQIILYIDLFQENNLIGYGMVILADLVSQGHQQCFIPLISQE